MAPRRPRRALLLTVILAGATWILQAETTQDRPDVATVIAQVGERLAVYYQRARQIVCLERSTVIPIDARWTAQGFGRTVESELRVEMEAVDSDWPAEPHVTREVRRVNGRAPRESDRVDRSGCTDPTPLSPEPVAFLLSANRDGYRFSAVRHGRERGRAALVIDFASARPAGHPVLIEDELGHDDCFDWKGPIATAGRLWVDAATGDVLRLERRNAGLTDVRVPLSLQRKHHFTPWVTIDRDDMTIRYKDVTFSEPHEVLLLPESIESVTILRTTLQSIRRTQVFSGYRRFLTESRIRVP
jgi:hypothetical protein